MTVTQRSQTDCEVAALATASGRTWEQAREALGWRDLPGDAENPIFGNPENVKAGIERLGFKPIRRIYHDIVSGIATKGKTMVLLHNPGSPNLLQHWVVFADRSPTHVVFHWGDGNDKSFRFEQFLKLYSGGFPNTAFEVGPFQGKIGWIQRVLNWIKNLFRGR